MNSSHTTSPSEHNDGSKRIKLDLLPTTELQTRRNTLIGTHTVTAVAVPTKDNSNSGASGTSDDSEFTSTKELQTDGNPLIGNNRFSLTSNLKEALLTLDVGKKVSKI